MPVLFDQPAQRIAALAVALRTLDANHVKLADKIAERGAGALHLHPISFSIKTGDRVQARDCNVFSQLVVFFCIQRRAYQVVAKRISRLNRLSNGVFNWPSRCKPVHDGWKICMANHEGARQT